jgi:hypothetical protein
MGLISVPVTTFKAECHISGEDRRRFAFVPYPLAHMRISRPEITLVGKLTFKCHFDYLQILPAV